MTRHKVSNRVLSGPVTPHSDCTLLFSLSNLDEDQTTLMNVHLSSSAELPSPAVAKANQGISVTRDTDILYCSEVTFLECTLFVFGSDNCKT